MLGWEGGGEESRREKKKKGWGVVGRKGRVGKKGPLLVWFFLGFFFDSTIFFFSEVLGFGHLPCAPKNVPHIIFICRTSYGYPNFNEK